MSIAENTALVQRLFQEVWNQGNEEILNELIVPTAHGIASSSGLSDTMHLRSTIRMLRKAFPDWHVTIEDMIAMPDRVITRWQATGTHCGAFMGLPPTGRGVNATGISIFYIADGRIHSERVSRDSLSMLRQVCTALTSEPISEAWAPPGMSAVRDEVSTAMAVGCTVNLLTR